MPRAHFSANCPNDPVANSPGVELVIGHSMPNVFELCPNGYTPDPMIASGFEETRRGDDRAGLVVKLAG